MPEREDDRTTPRKGKIVGPKRPFTKSEIWRLRESLKIQKRTRDLALLNLGVDSKLRACDLLRLRVSDVCTGYGVNTQATIVQQKTEEPVTFEITESTRLAVSSWIQLANLASNDFLWRSRNRSSVRLSMSQYSRIIKGFAEGVDADARAYGAHSIRRTKVTMVYKESQNIRACQLLLGHKKIENTVRYLGLELKEALEISRDIEI
jgi:integrase